jgi:hypothetical protein
MSEPGNDDEDLAEVITLDRTAPPAKATPRELGTCMHHTVEVSASEGSLTCTKCKRPVSPLWWIEKLAGRWSREVARQKQIASDVKAAEAKLAELKAEEARTRSRVGRLRGRDDEPARQPFPSDLADKARRADMPGPCYLVRVQVEAPSRRRLPEDQWASAAVVAVVADDEARPLLETIKRLINAGGRGSG